MRRRWLRTTVPDHAAVAASDVAAIVAAIDTNAERFVVYANLTLTQWLLPGVLARVVASDTATASVASDAAASDASAASVASDAEAASAASDAAASGASAASVASDAEAASAASDAAASDAAMDDDDDANAKPAADPGADLATLLRRLSVTNERGDRTFDSASPVSTRPTTVRDHRQPCASREDDRLTRDVKLYGALLATELADGVVNDAIMRGNGQMTKKS